MLFSVKLQESFEPFVLFFLRTKRHLSVSHVLTNFLKLYSYPFHDFTVVNYDITKTTEHNTVQILFYLDWSFTRIINIIDYQIFNSHFWRNWKVSWDFHLSWWQKYNTAQKRSFPLRISSVNMTKSAVSLPSYLWLNVFKHPNCSYVSLTIFHAFIFYFQFYDCLWLINKQKR